MTRLFALVVAAAILVAVEARAAEDAGSYPNRPIRWIVPFPPGGAADLVSRALSQKIAERLGQQIVIDNRAGAAGNIGTELAARAAPDGYTVVIVPATFTTNPALSSKLAYDPQKSFAPISLVSSSALVLVVHPSLPATSIKALVALAKARPGQLNYASSGVGASAHLAAELFRSATDTELTHVPYKGQPPAMIDMLSGQVQVMFANIPVSLPHIRSGRLRGLGVTTLSRTSLFPELPTIAESGIPGFEVNQWSGLLAPAGTAPPLVQKLYDAVSAALKEPDVRAGLTAQGFDPVGSTPADFARYIAAEIAKWNAVIRKAGIRAD
ncbi:MAG TPA: tripartite tricarboxylate transporter substrate binding protein [Burkholderiales bacterium]|nr:tripartite tricarboxylate transporter substrate binding protein [Burkholderiales bacterium]